MVKIYILGEHVKYRRTIFDIERKSVGIINQILVFLIGFSEIGGPKVRRAVEGVLRAEPIC